MTERYKVQIDCGPTMTKQSFQQECDVNFIMNKWKRTGEIPAAMVGTLPPSYGDFSNPTDYMTALNQVIEAKEAFAHLPAFLRDRFANQPVNLLAFLANPDNQEEAVKLGLAEAPERSSSEKSPETTVVPDTPPGETIEPKGITVITP